MRFQRCRNVRVTAAAIHSNTWSRTRSSTFCNTLELCRIVLAIDGGPLRPLLQLTNRLSKMARSRDIVSALERSTFSLCSRYSVRSV